MAGAPPRARGRRARSATAIAIAAGVALAIGIAVVAGRVPRRPPEPAAPPPPSPAPAPGAAEPAPDPRPIFLAARAALRCGPERGEAVFVEPELAVGSVGCREGDPQLLLPDGRELLARLVAGAPPGTSVLRVPGAAAPRVPVGSAVALLDGAPLLVALEGSGPGVVGEATARGFANLDGTALLRVEDAGGPLGGPVVDATGRLVAMAPSSPPDPARPVLAVPVEAFATLLGVAPPEAWTAVRDQAVDAERRIQGDLWNRLVRAPMLVAAPVGDDGLDLVVARASAGRPAAETVRLVLQPVARNCTLAGRIVEWATGPRAFDGLGVPGVVAARLGRLVPPPGAAAVWAGRGRAEIDCDLSAVAGGTTVSIPGTDPVEPVPFPRDALVPALERWAGNQAGVARSRAETVASDAAQAAEAAAAFEAEWRQAFREAHARIAEARGRRKAIEAERDQARGNFQYVLEQQLSDDLENARLDERRAEEALHELDRRASLEAVPRTGRKE